jgi:UDP-glucose 4-epimerase
MIAAAPARFGSCPTGYPSGVRIVITGASGNVGTALLRRLRESGDPADQVVAVSRRRPAQLPPYDGVEWHTVDIGEPAARSELERVFAGADVVVHLAWLIQPTRQRDVMRRVNQEGTRAVRDAAISAGVAHLVHQSSVGTYSPGHGRTVDENWPTDGIPSSTYSVDKAAAERLMDDAEDKLLVTRVRPALIFQDDAASEIARYFIGPFVPRPLIRRGLLRFLPLPDAMAFQVVHADDVAAALDLIVHRQAGGAFNVAASPTVDRAAWREIFGGVGPALPPPAIRALASATWRAHLQQTEPGWIDLAASVPWLRTDRLRELGWTPTRDARTVLGSFIDAMGQGAGHAGPVLYPAREH